MAKLLKLPKGVKYSQFDKRQLEVGTRHEMEHTRSRRTARLIAAQHLLEDPHYYTHLERMEREVKQDKRSRNGCRGACEVTVFIYSARFVSAGRRRRRR